MSTHPIQWKRNCPKCSKELFYSRKDGLVRAVKSNRKCFLCSMKEIIPWNKGLNCETSEKVKLLIEKMSITLKGRKLPHEVIQKIIVSRRGYQHSSETKKKIGLANSGKIRTQETKDKLSVSAIKRIQKYKLYNKPNFNPIACDFINNLNYSLGFNFQHALNGGEIWLHGFYPDGYDKIKNIVFEYDEPWHKSEKFKKYDFWKEKCIIEKIHPQMFIRYDKKNNRLYDALTNIDVSINPSIII